MKTIIIYRKDGLIRVMKVDAKSHFEHLGRDLEGNNFLRQENL